MLSYIFKMSSLPNWIFLFIPLKFFLFSNPGLPFWDILKESMQPY